jgi:glycosyltransferase involved in cell wall biosynthesis
LEECRRFGVNSRDSSGNLAERLIRRMELEFANCDRIVVPSAVANQSFVERGWGEKTVVVQTGVDADFFSPRPIAAPSATFRVCFVGRLEFAKGVGYLLEAWKRLSLPRAELLLVGELKPQIEPMLKNYGGPGVSLTGFLPQQQVAQCYRESNLFVQPSPNEGLAQVLLEAMASGLPVVATDRTGAADCVTDGKEGWKIPARSVDALADAIWWCYRRPAETQVMGTLARARIESQFTLEHYNQRVLALYQELAGPDCKPTQRTY